MKTQDEINKAAENYAPHDEYHGATYQTNLLMKRQGFVMGATFANGYSVEEMCGFAEWVNGNTYKASNKEYMLIGKDELGTYRITDLLKLYNERK
ncbi:MAG: hypothetical protein WC055_02195 [Melioribacteraceae bacterium]